MPSGSLFIYVSYSLMFLGVRDHFSGLNYGTLEKMSFHPGSALRVKFYPLHIDSMSAVQFSRVLILNENLNYSKYPYV